MRTRIKDIADRVGVSVSLVSMYLNHHPLSARISEQTKRRIDEAVRELHYTPSATARSLKMGRSRTLGLVISEIARVYSSFLTQCLMDEAERHGYQLLLSLTHYDRQKELESLRNLVSRQADGILYHLHLPVEEPPPAFVQNVPLLLYSPHPACNAVYPDERDCFLRLFEILSQRGFRRVLCVHEGLPLNAGLASECARGFPLDIAAMQCRSLPELIDAAAAPHTCLVFFSSVLARHFLRHCQERGLHDLPPFVYSYTLPYDLIESPKVICAMTRPLRTFVTTAMERLVEMVERPQPTIRHIPLHVDLMSPEQLREHYLRQLEDPYYGIIVREHLGGIPHTHTLSSI